jgi:hypothetical protein
MVTLACATALADLYGGVSSGTMNSIAATGTPPARRRSGRRSRLRRNQLMRRLQAGLG